MNKNEFKKYFILIAFAALCLWLVNNINVIGNLIAIIIKVLLPFIIGGVLAFILNIPMVKIEKLLFKVFKKKHKNLVRILSIILALLFFILILAFILLLLIPELITNIELLVDTLPNLMDKGEQTIVSLLEKYPDVQKQIIDMFESNKNVGTIIGDILSYIAAGAIDIISSIISSAITLFTGIIFAIYMLSQKEYLCNGSKKVLKAYFKEKTVKKVLKITELSNDTFNKFISGQCVDAIILGFILFIVLIIFRFPYALIIAVLTSITALIPIFGALIAMVIGAILIAITSPIDALIFIMLFLIIQQIEGNFIYPKIVGKSVGLSPMWTLLAITVGGNLFGIIGMLLGLPLASIVYSLIKNDVNKRIKS